VLLQRYFRIELLVVTPLLLPLLLGILMKHTHRYGALAGTAAALVWAAVNKFVLGWTFGWETLISTSICFLTMWLSGFVPESDSYRERVAAFFTRMREPRAVPTHPHEVPPPLPVVGAFMVLIGALVCLLGFAPQPALDRVVTFAAAVVLMGLGLLMRRRKFKEALERSLENL